HDQSKPVWPRQVAQDISASQLVATGGSWVARVPAKWPPVRRQGHAPMRERRSRKFAQGRIDHGPPIAVFHIGSNSVRLVAYEGLTRSPTPIFNEKVLAGLGREVQTTGLLAPDAVEKALGALMRFRALCNTMGVTRMWAIATAACRDARNGRAFIAEAQRICGS